MATAELLFQLKGDPSNVKQVLAQVRAELSQTQKSTESINKSELSARSQIAAAQSLQRQRSAALITQWKQQETAARQAAAGTRPFGETLEGVRGALVALQGPLGGFASRATALSGLFSSMAVGAVGVTVALGALAVAAVAGAIAFFRLVQSVSETTGKFFDLSQQVGVSVETLSTLSTLASTTGGNIDTVTASLGLFQRNLEEAHDPTSKEAKLLKELGVTSLETETALRQTLRGLFNLGEGAKQTDATLQLFGRSGRFVNAILKESKGDLDAATERLQKMALVISGPAAAAADRFNDSLVILQGQLGAIARTLASDTIPVFIVFFEQISVALTGNEKSWQNWGRVVESTVAGVIASFQAMVAFIASRGTASFSDLFDAFFIGILQRAQKLRNELFAQSEIEKFGRLTQLALGLGGRPGDRPDADNAKSQAQARANKALQLQQQALEEQTRRHREALERERELDLKSIDEWEDESRVALTRHLEAQQQIFAQEETNINRFVKDQADRLIALTELSQKQTKAVNDTIAAIQKVEDDAQRRRDQSSIRIEQQLFAIEEERRRGQLDIIKRALDEQGITEAEALTRQLALLKESHEQRLVLINAELELLTTSAARTIELDNLKIESEQRFTNELARLIEERKAARERELLEQGPGARGVPEPSGRVLSDEDIAILGKLPDLLTRWQEVMRSLKAELVDFSAFVTDTLIFSIKGIADAVGQAVAAWALYGESFGKAMRMALAAVLARIATEALMQSVLHAAYAIGNLAFGNYVAAAKHGIAAAKFAAVAAAAGISARVVSGAGNSFGGGGANDTTRERPQPLTTIITGRNQPQNQTVRHVVEVQVVDRGLGPVIDAHLIRSIGDGGPLREVIQRDGR